MKLTKREGALYRLVDTKGLPAIATAEIVQTPQGRVTIASNGAAITRVYESTGGEHGRYRIARGELAKAYKVEGVDLEVIEDGQGLPLGNAWLATCGGVEWATKDINLTALTKALAVHKVDKDSADDEMITVIIGEYGLKIASNNGRVQSLLY